MLCFVGRQLPILQHLTRLTYSVQLRKRGFLFLLYTFAERIASAIFASTQHMLCQNRRRHTADAAGDRGVRFYDLSCILRTDVTRYGTVR